MASSRRKRTPKISPDAVKAAAERAVKRSKGEDIEEPKVPITPSIERASSAGRKSEYKPAFCQTAAEMALGGSTDEEIAEECGVDVRTLYRWKAKHDEFRQALQWGKDNCDERVERSLYARAVGYTYDAVKIFQYEGAPVIVPHKEHVPPDTGAAKMWLTNRKRKDWSETVRQEVSGPGGAPIEIEAVAKIDLARWIANMLTNATAPVALEATAQDLGT